MTFKASHNDSGRHLNDSDILLPNLQAMQNGKPGFSIYESDHLLRIQDFTTILHPVVRMTINVKFCNAIFVYGL